MPAVSASGTWVTPRGGLALAGRALAARPGAIAYAGNSVTAQRKGYRPRLHECLARHLGQPHRAINAGFGATGSIGSLYTLPELVLRHRPDLCFIECTTGDVGIGAAPDTVGPIVEGMIRQLTAIGCACCVLHLYRHDAAFADDVPLIAAYERVAAHYGVPSINIGRVFAGLPAAERDGACFDGIHLTASGATLVADRIAGAVAALCDVPPAAAVPPGRCHAEDYAGARIAPARIDMLAAPAPGNASTFRMLHPVVETASGNDLRFRTAVGPVDGLLLVIGPSAGYIEVDAGTTRMRLLTWDAWCTYDRLQAVVLPVPVAADVPMRVAALDTAVPGAPAAQPARKRLRVVGFMVRGPGEVPP